MANILITGGTGLVGKRLTDFLLKKKHNVRVLSRTPSAKNEYKWDVVNDYIDEEALLNLDYIIHLAGAGIADKRWTSERKKVIIDSRVATANLLYSKIKALNIPLKGFISASGSNFYGAKTTNTIYTETDNAGTDFLGDVCLQWENAAQQFDTLKIPVTLLRTGIVLSKKGGALQKMKTPIISPLGQENNTCLGFILMTCATYTFMRLSKILQGFSMPLHPIFKPVNPFQKYWLKVSKALICQWQFRDSY